MSTVAVLEALALVGGSIAVWVVLLGALLRGLRRVADRLRSRGVELDSAEGVDCGTVLRVADPHDTGEDDELEYASAEAVLCPSCGTPNSPEFYRCRECVAPVRRGSRSAD